MARRQRFDYMPPIEPERCAAADGKHIYPNKAEAEHAVDRARAEREADVRVYRDDRCGHWHLTKSAQW